MVVLSGLAAMAAAVGPAAAQDGAAWTRYTSPSALLSAEVPCSAATVEQLAKLPADVGVGTPLDPANRVMCKAGGWIYVAGLVSDPSVEGGAQTAFDLIKEAVLADETGNGTARELTIGGRRAFVNREIRDDYRADAGFIEVDKTTVALIASGGPTGQANDMNAAMDRFAQSIRVSGQ